jgi:hypothetical protein
MRIEQDQSMQNGQLLSGKAGGTYSYRLALKVNHTERQSIEQEFPGRNNLHTFLILFNENVNSLQKYGIAQDYRILHRLVWRLSKHYFKI